jgi:arsenate reductase (glutaredoxin)
MKLYWYAGCSTCKKARKHLGDREVSVVELKTDPPTAAELADLHARSGLPLKKFFNVAGQSYRGGGFKDRIGSMSEQEQYDALAADGMLIKRPILDLGDRVLVGFKEADWP